MLSHMANTANKLLYLIESNNLPLTNDIKSLIGEGDCCEHILQIKYNHWQEYVSEICSGTSGS